MENPNLDYINELAGDDHIFQRKFIEILKTELPIEIDQYQDHLHQNKLFEASEVVHKLKHKINILGLTQSYRLALAHEEELRKGGTQNSTGFMAILGQMNAYINTI